MKLVHLLCTSLALSLASAQCYNRTYTFKDGISADWDLQTTQARQRVIGGDWTMHSIGTGADNWSRMRYAKYTFNNYPNATTRIRVQVRGAPNGGKNSNAYLMQTKGIYTLNAAVQDGTKDEIDLFEYYGGSNRETMNVFRKGKQVVGFPQTLVNVKNAGRQFYTYELILKNWKRYMLVTVFNSTGSEIDRREMTGDSVPSNPMELFIGIWDCSSWCSGKVSSDTWMAVRSVIIEAC